MARVLTSHKKKLAFLTQAVFFSEGTEGKFDLQNTMVMKMKNVDFRVVLKRGRLQGIQNRIFGNLYEYFNA